MTEFYNVGKHCDHPTCHQKDFLPFECELCKHTYCLDHRDLADHACGAIHQHLMESTIPVCPLCDAPVSKREPLEDNNLVIMRHWESGQCPKNGGHTVAKKKQKTCSHDKCSEYKVLTHCRTCNEEFCLNHRLEADHKCKKATQHQPSINNTLGNIHKQRAVKELYSTIKPSVNKKALIAKRQPTEKVAFTNTWNEAVLPGPKKPNLEEQDKLFAHVYFPHQSYIQPVRLFLDTRWSVGKLIDILADFGKVTNTNNKVSLESNERLNLYIFNGQVLVPLNNSTKISDLSKQGVLRNKESIIVLERGVSGQNLVMNYDNLESIVREMKTGRSNIKLAHVHTNSLPITV
jgi:predicted nucleic acid binding AN1-type Zn finger protein